MLNIKGLQQVFFNRSSVNDSASENKFNNLSLLNKPIKDTVSFGYFKDYTRDKFKALRMIAEILGLPDFYNGKKFSDKYKPTIEHIIPQGKDTRQRAKDIGLASVNSLGNIVLAGNKTNNKKDNMTLKEWYKLHPEYIKNGRQALKEYEKVHLQEHELFVGSPYIDGRKWVKRLKNTLNKELGYIAFSGRKNQNIAPSDSPQKLSYVA
ncbi:MAG: DUF1524 domain-containing protein [bacterium]